MSCSSAGVFAVGGAGCCHDWPEKSQRERAWYPLDEAAMLVGEGGLVGLILDMNANLIGP